MRLIVCSFFDKRPNGHSLRHNNGISMGALGIRGCLLALEYKRNDALFLS